MLSDVRNKQMVFGTKTIGYTDHRALVVHVRMNPLEVHSETIEVINYPRCQRRLNDLDCEMFEDFEVMYVELTRCVEAAKCSKGSRKS